MHEYRITWRYMPFAYNSEQVVFVEAESESDAKLIAIDHIERKYRVTQDKFRVQGCSLAPAKPKGRVIE